MNKKFPKWKEANFILSDLVNKTFDIYIDIGEYDPSNIHIKFLNFNNIPIPPEEINTFRFYYNEFILYMESHISFKKIMEKYLYKLYNEDTIFCMMADFKSAIKAYEYQNNISVKEVLLKFLGVNNVGIIEYNN